MFSPCLGHGAPSKVYHRLSDCPKVVPLWKMKTALPHSKMKFQAWLPPLLRSYRGTPLNDLIGELYWSLASAPTSCTPFWKLKCLTPKWWKWYSCILHLQGVNRNKGRVVLHMVKISKIQQMKLLKSEIHVHVHCTFWTYCTMLMYMYKYWLMGWQVFFFSCARHL